MSLSMLKDVADYLTPVLQSSQFSSTGVLTPDEFTLSGDQLVHSCRTWQWDAGKAGTQKPYLQPSKQFLITRNVPCMCRANAYYHMQVDTKRSPARGQPLRCSARTIISPPPLLFAAPAPLSRV